MGRNQFGWAVGGVLAAGTIFGGVVGVAGQYFSSSSDSSNPPYREVGQLQQTVEEASPSGGLYDQIKTGVVVGAGVGLALTGLALLVGLGSQSKDAMCIMADGKIHSSSD